MKTQHPQHGNFDDLVFENRNKLYGAYLLRKTYNGSLLKALAISALLTFILLFLATRKWTREQVIIIANDTQKTVVDIIDEKIYKQEEKEKIEQPKSKPQIATRTVESFSVNGKQDPKETDKKILTTAAENRDGENREIIDPDWDLPAGENKDGNKKPEVIPTGPMNIAEVEIMPEFPGGMSALSKFLNNYLQRNNQWSEMGLTGNVYVEFVVDKEGTVTDVKAVAGPYDLLKKTSEKAIKSMPKWKPGRQNGHDVAVILKIPINFVTRP